jgi:acetylglutamate kinase
MLILRPNSKNNAKNESTMLKIYKIGGGIIDNPQELQQFLRLFADIEGDKILVHGGGRSADQLLKQMGIAPNMLEGKRITDAPTLEVVTMTYAGEINTKLVAGLQAVGCNALGLSGADGNAIRAVRRPIRTIDYGFVGDIDMDSINIALFKKLALAGLTPVVCAITHDGKGQLLNTNADTIAATIAAALAQQQPTELYYCFDKKGVLMDKNDENSFIPQIRPQMYQELKSQGIISDGMIPKLDNAFATLAQGVQKVVLQHALLINSDTKTEIIG